MEDTSNPASLPAAVSVGGAVPTGSGQNIPPNPLPNSGNIVGTVETGITNVTSVIAQGEMDAATAVAIAAAASGANSAPASADPVMTALARLEQRLTQVEALVNPVVQVGAEVAGVPSLADRITTLESGVNEVLPILSAGAPVFTKMLADLGVKI